MMTMVDIRYDDRPVELSVFDFVKANLLGEGAGSWEALAFALENTAEMVARVISLLSEKGMLSHQEVWELAGKGGSYSEWKERIEDGIKMGRYKLL